MLRTAALLTTKIRALWDHLTRNPRDIHNRRSLRGLVHQRAKVLKYLKRELRVFPYTNSIIEYFFSFKKQVWMPQDMLLFCRS